MEEPKVFYSTEEYAREKKQNKEMLKVKPVVLDREVMKRMTNLLTILSYVPSEKLNSASDLISDFEFHGFFRDFEISEMRDKYSGKDESESIDPTELTEINLKALALYKNEYRFYNDVLKPYLKVKYLLSVAEYPEASGVLSQFK